MNNLGCPRIWQKMKRLEKRNANTHAFRIGRSPSWHTRPCQKPRHPDQTRPSALERVSNWSKKVENVAISGLRQNKDSYPYCPGEGGPRQWLSPGSAIDSAGVRPEGGGWCVRLKRSCKPPVWKRKWEMCSQKSSSEGMQLWLTVQSYLTGVFYNGSRRTHSFMTFFLHVCVSTYAFHMILTCNFWQNKE